MDMKRSKLGKSVHHGHETVQTSGVGAPMVPRGHVIHHQQRCSAQHLHRSTNSEQPLSMVHDRSSLPRSSRVLIRNISQKCSRDDCKRTLGGLHGHETVQTSGVGPPMVPRGHVIHHHQRCRAQQQVIPTIARLIWQSSFESLTRRRSGASQKALECYIRRRRR